MNQKADNRYAVILGEGIWRWRLFDQLQNETTDNFANFFSQIITYLAVKENKDPFKINLQKEYEESDQVVVRAELYNASYQLTNDPEIKFRLIDEASKEFDYTFFRTNDSYILELGRLKQGIYRWEAKANFEGQPLVKKGTFLVRETKKELLNLSANHRPASKRYHPKTNGQFYSPNDLNQLEKDIMDREDIIPITYQEKAFKDIIDYQWLLAFILIFLVSEWFIRKYQGRVLIVWHGRLATGLP